MRLPSEVYAEGYAKGRSTNLADATGDAIFGLLRDDPGGYFSAGYSDGSGGRKFNPPSDAGQKPRPQQSSGSSASELERSWFRFCDASEFISEEIVKRFSTALSAEGSYAEFMVGLSPFAEYTCPRCASRGQYRVHFLGELKHPTCGWSGYMRTGPYIGHQVVQIFHTGARAGGSAKDDMDRKGDQGGWVLGIFGFLFGAVFRAALAAVVIPLHIAVVLTQSKKG